MRMNKKMTVAELMKVSLVHPRIKREDRNRQIREMRSKGHSLREVGTAFGLTYERIRQVCSEAVVAGQGGYYLAALNTCAGPRLLPDGSWCIHDFAPVWACLSIPEGKDGKNLGNMACERCGVMVLP